jgi:hypothetical protein
MAPLRQSRFYVLARHLSLGRIVRYLGLWARYFWRRVWSILNPASAGDEGPSVIEAVLRLKRADDLSASVDQLVSAGEVFGTLNTAL